MIIIKLQGGLGNQMFQYAMGRYLSVKNNTDLLMDIGYFEKSKIRRYELDAFKIDASIATNDDISLAKKIYLKEEMPDFDENILKTKGDAYIEGYFQSEKYFLGIEDAIRNEFKLKDTNGKGVKSKLSDIQKSDSISIHIRRTDYLTDKHKKIYTGMPIEYYENAIRIISCKCAMPELFIFSDDVAWVKNNLITPPDVEARFVSGMGFTDQEELFLMSQCKHNIIANSTFSWWGAWLNENSGKIVITPRRWFTDKNRDESDLIPPSWIKL